MNSPLPTFKNCHVAIFCSGMSVEEISDNNMEDVDFGITATNTYISLVDPTIKNNRIHSLDGGIVLTHNPFVKYKIAHNEFETYYNPQSFYLSRHSSSIYIAPYTFFPLDDQFRTETDIYSNKFDIYNALYESVFNKAIRLTFSVIHLPETDILNYMTKT